MRVHAHLLHSLNLINKSNIFLGPVLTDMYTKICSDSKNESVRKMLTGQLEALVRIEDTCMKLVKTLATKNYANGDRVDYYKV